jgi:hypothetical protein
VKNLDNSMGEQAANTEHPKEPEERILGNAQNFSHTYCAFCRPWNCQDFARKVPKFTPCRFS